ncbi:MAG: hypothetical protein ACOY4P_16870 [Pseudomonadota bacterium]
MTLDLITVGIALLAGIVAALIGGAVGGIVVGGKHMGNGLAATMGGFFGPVAGVPGLIIGLAVLFALA